MSWLVDTQRSKKLKRAHYVPQHFLQAPIIKQNGGHAEKKKG